MLINMNKPYTFTLLFFSFSVFANEGHDLHKESCLECHTAPHNKDFYTRDDRKVKDLSQLSGQVSRCTGFFRVGWFPEEEKSVVDYLNENYYKFKE